VIVFRTYDARFPFLWETDDQPAARWHDEGEGPVHYFADTPSGAWAEFIRHEEITDADDLAGVHRAMCAVEIDPIECVPVGHLPLTTLIGGEATYAECQIAASEIRNAGHRGLRAPSAALKAGEARGMCVDQGIQDGPDRSGIVFVLFGRRPDLMGWQVTTQSRPPMQVLQQTRPI
jgi:hypothetical protein